MDFKIFFFTIINLIFQFFCEVFDMPLYISLAYSNVNILYKHSYGYSKIRNYYCWYNTVDKRVLLTTKKITCFIQISVFLQMSFEFQETIQNPTLCLVVPYPRSPPICSFLNLPLSFVTLIFLKSIHQIFYRINFPQCEFL